MSALEAALAIQLGKSAPVGYDEAARFFRETPGRATPAHNTWLMVEAEKAGRLEDLHRDFPDAEHRTRALIDTMRRNHPDEIERLLGKVTDSSYIGRMQRDSAEAFRKLFPDSIEPTGQQPPRALPPSS